MPKKGQKKENTKSDRLKGLKKVINNYWLTGFIALFVIFISIFDKAKEYITSFPAWGCDFLMPMSVVSFFKEHILSLPLWGWYHLSAGGYPLFRGFPWLHIYPIVGLTNFFGYADAARIYYIFTFFAFLFFTFLLIRQLSKSWLLGLSIAVALAWTPAFWTQLFYNGSVAAAATQGFLPLCLYLVVKYYHNRSRRYLFFAVLASGICFAGHVAVALVTYGLTLAVLFFWRDEENKLFSKKKLKDGLLFAILAPLVGMATLWPMIEFSLKAMGVQGTVQTSTPFLFLYEKTSYFFWLPVGIILLSVLIKRKFREATKAVSFILALCFLAAWLMLFYWGKNPISGVGPERQAWMVLLLAGTIVAVWWGALARNKGIFSIIIKAAVLTSFIFCFVFSQYHDPDFYYKNDMAMFPGKAQVIFEKDSQFQIEDILPGWLDYTETNYRLWQVGYGFSMWWNVFSPLPLFNSAFNPHFQDADFWAWADYVIPREEFEELNDSEKKITEAEAKFVMDWGAIRYIADTGPVPYFFGDEEILSNETKEGAPLHIGEIDEDLISPVVSATNAPSIYVIGDDISYRNMLRNFGALNFNSQKGIMVKGADYIDDIVKDDLSEFDAVILYDYFYRSEHNFKERPEEPWQVLEEFVKNGGKLFIDTGARGKEGDSNSLPAVFPINASKKGGLGQSWDLNILDESLASELNPQSFSPLTYDDGPWAVAYAPTSDAVKEWGEVILEQKGKPVMVAGQYGEGEVVWTGLNLAYRLKYCVNYEETKILSYALDYLLDEKITEPKAEVERPKPEKIVVSGEDFKGVLVKENYVSAWQAKLVSGGKTEEISLYPAGPDLMYARLPENTDFPARVELRFKGELSAWLSYIISALTIIFVVEYLIFKKILLFGLFNKVFGKFSVRGKKWWDKDDEE